MPKLFIFLFSDSFIHICPFPEAGYKSSSTCFALPLLALFIICNLVRSYSNSSFRSFSLLSSTSTGLIRYFPATFRPSMAARYRLSTVLPRNFEASCIDIEGSTTSPYIVVISYSFFLALIASFSRRSSGTVPCCQSGSQRLPVPVCEAHPLPPGLYVPHVLRTGGIPSTVLLLIHISLIESDSDHQICDVLRSGHTCCTGNIFLFGFRECWPDGASFFSSFLLLEI